MHTAKMYPKHILTYNPMRVMYSTDLNGVSRAGRWTA